LPQGEFIQNSKDLFNTVIENVPKITQGKPNCHLFYATTGTYPHAKEIEGTFKNIQQRIKDSGYFKEVTVLPVDRDELVKLWSLTYSGVEAKFEVKGYTPYPEISGIKEAYLAIVPAQNFIKNILSDEDGKLRTFIFEENVRSFLGQDNPVNKMINKRSLMEAEERDLVFLIMELQLSPPMLKYKVIQYILKTFKLLMDVRQVTYFMKIKAFYLMKPC